MEFDRMCQGYHRRQIEHWRRARWQATVQINLHRAPGEPAWLPEEVMRLPGDPPYQPALTEQEFDDTMARLAEFDTLQAAA